MKDNALKDIKNISVKISMEAVEHLIKNSIDKNKLEKLYIKSLEQTKAALKQTKAQRESYHEKDVSEISQRNAKNKFYLFEL